MEKGVDLGGHRILIVEDDFLLGMELEVLLKQQGCAVLGPVPSVGQALALLDHERPDLALLDVNLKGETATPVAAALRDRGVPFVLITGYSREQLSAPELHRAPRVEKPVDRRDLMRAIACALNAGKAGPKP